MSIAATLYWVVGIGGYMTFRARTSGDLLRNLGAAHAVGLRGAYERAIKLCYGLSILGAIPLVITPFHGALLAMMGPAVEAAPLDVGPKKHRLVCVKCCMALPTITQLCLVQCGFMTHVT